MQILLIRALGSEFGPQTWEINATIIDLEEFKPNNVVTVDEIVYFHISRHEVVFYYLGEGQPRMLNVPV